MPTRDSKTSKSSPVAEECERLTEQNKILAGQNKSASREIDRRDDKIGELKERIGRIKNRLACAMEHNSRLLGYLDRVRDEEKMVNPPKPIMQEIAQEESWGPDVRSYSDDPFGRNDTKWYDL